MKKCPYCAEEIQDEAKICRWCHKDLVNNGLNSKLILRLSSFFIISIAIFSFFMPFARIQIPIMGTQTFSGMGVLLQSLKSSNTESQEVTPETQQINVSTLKQAVESNGYDQILNKKPIYKFIPFGLICGGLTYLLLIIIAIGLFIKKPLLVLLQSIFAFFTSVLFLISFFLIDDLFHYIINSSMSQLQDNPFAGLATLFTGGIKIEPAIAIYLLLITTPILGILSWYDYKEEAIKADTPTPGGWGQIHQKWYGVPKWQKILCITACVLIIGGLVGVNLKFPVSKSPQEMNQEISSTRTNPNNTVNYPSQTGSIVDDSGILDDQGRSNIEAMIDELKQKTSVRITVVTVESTEPLAIDDYAMNLFQRYGIGSNGVLLLMAHNDRHMRIEVGSGLEGVITNVLSRQIIDTIMAPQFKAGNFSAGFENAIAAIVDALQSSQTQQVTQPTQADSDFIPAVDVKESFTVNVPNAQGGYTTVTITKVRGGYKGQKGETYMDFPTIKELQSVYGLN